jgi:hypothetical protein
MSDKIFTQGMIVKRHEKAPSYVVCGLSFKTEEFIKWLQENDKGGWVNVDVKQSQGGKYYGELNTYEKGSQTSKKAPNSNEKAKDEEYTNSGDTGANKANSGEVEILPEDVPF